MEDTLEDIIGEEPDSKNAVEALIGIMRSPLAKRKGLYLDKVLCSEWADELEEFLKRKH